MTSPFSNHPSRKITTKRTNPIKLANQVPSRASTSENGARPPRSGPHGRRWLPSCFPERSAECSGWTWTPSSRCSTPCTRWTSREAAPRPGRRRRTELPPAPRLPRPLLPRHAPALTRGKGAARDRGVEKDAGGGKATLSAMLPLIIMPPSALMGKGCFCAVGGGESGAGQNVACGIWYRFFHRPPSCRR